MIGAAPRRSARLRRKVVLVALALPLLSAGTCLNLARESVINGFFDAVTPALDQQLQDTLGLDTTGAGGSGAAAGTSP